MAASPWQPVAAPVTNTMEEIMSEEYARGLQEKEDKLYAEQLLKEPPSMAKCAPAAVVAGCSKSPDSQYVDVIPDDVLKALQEEDGAAQYSNDAIIAQMLQAQYDMDHDAELKTVERHQNKAAKVKISYRNYQLVPDNWIEPENIDDHLPEDVGGNGVGGSTENWDRFETVEKEFSQIPKCGYKYDEDGEIVTKHDERMNGVRNACRVMSFPPEFCTGDGGGFDMKLSNKVFNHLKRYSHRSKRSKMHDRKENVATAEMGIDEPTRLILYKMINNQLLEQVNGIISTGKEAVILHADSDSNYEGEILNVPKECAIKIFKTTLNDFKQRDRYIKDDYRFKDRFSKQNNRTVIAMWAEKEMHNLMRLQKVNINCPEVVTLKNNVLVMSFIGRDNRAAPKLKDVILSEAELIVAYEEVLDMMTRMYKEANLVHADLSEYNILYFEGKCYFIDVAQSIEPGHPSAFEYLLRDCGNVVHFFEKKGMKGLANKTKEELFTEITGLDPNVHHTTMLERLHNKGVPEHVATSQDVDQLPDEFKPLPFPFDYAFEKNCDERAGGTSKKNKQDQVNKLMQEITIKDG